MGSACECLQAQLCGWAAIQCAKGCIAPAALVHADAAEHSSAQTSMQSWVVGSMLLAAAGVACGQPCLGVTLVRYSHPVVSFVERCPMSLAPYRVIRQGPDPVK